MASKLENFSEIGFHKKTDGALPIETETGNYCILFKADGSRGESFDIKNKADLFIQLALYFPDWTRAEVYEENEHSMNIDLTFLGEM